NKKFTSKLLNKYLEHKQNQDTLVIRGRFSPLFIATWILGDGQIALYYGFKNNKALFSGRFDIYQGFAKDAFYNYLKNEFNLNNFKKKYSKYKEEIENLYDNYINLNPSFLEESTLIDSVGKIQNVYEEMITNTLFIEFLEVKMIKQVLGEININSKFIDDIIEYVAKTPFNSFEKRHENKKVNLIKNGINSEIINQAKYLYTDYFSTKDVNFIKKDLSSFKDRKYKNIIFNDTDFVLMLNSQDKKIYDYIKYITHLRDYRKDEIAKCQALLQLFSEEMAMRSGLNKQDSLYIITKELINGIDWISKNKSLIQDRQNGLEVFINSKSEILINNNQNIDLDNIEQQLSFKINNRIINGDSASKGRVVGYARIILDVSNYNVFNEGDILITSMTRPEFVPLMKKSSAIITNEGGITCHAAIVSRELRKPCITGTKFATQIIKDGDKVEVNADEGMVKIIESNNE
ncbi:MAG: PEP-utilizing enzyme, partial [Candidatus Paceibacterota bacterium]